MYSLDRALILRSTTPMKCRDTNRYDEVMSIGSEMDGRDLATSRVKR